MMPSPEQKYLAAIATINTRFDHNQHPLGIFPGNLHPERLINLAIQEGLACILYKNFAKSDRLGTFDVKLREKLQALYYRTLHFNLKLVLELRKILIELNKHNIKIVLLQGISLLHQCYDDIGLRPLSDIDLWMMKSDYPRLQRILHNQGYHADPIYPLTYRKGAITIDLHTHILWADRIHSRELLLNQDPKKIFQRTQAVGVDDQKAFCLDPFDQIIYLGMHLLKHNVERLVWLVDIRNLVADWKVSDWKALLERAKELGQTTCIAYTCFLLAMLLGFHPPNNIRSQLKNLNPIEKKILKQRIKKGALPQWSTLYLFSSGREVIKGGRLILETLFPRPDILRQVFPNHSELNIRRLYTRRFRQLLSMIKLT